MSSASTQDSSSNLKLYQDTRDPSPHQARAGQFKRSETDFKKITFEAFFTKKGLYIEVDGELQKCASRLSEVAPFFERISAPLIKDEHLDLFILWTRLCELEDESDSHNHGEFETCGICRESGEYYRAKKRYEEAAIAYVDSLMSKQAEYRNQRTIEQIE